MRRDAAGLRRIIISSSISGVDILCTTCLRGAQVCSNLSAALDSDSNSPEGELALIATRVCYLLFCRVT